jgi:hypothetical protein
VVENNLMKNNLMKENVMNSKATMAFCAVLIATGVAACGSDDGDEVTCPDCDNVTELLVGNKCVPIEEVEACGPDGHAHGSECHCFSGQQPTEIGGTEYCLQTECTDDHQEDPHAHACELLEGTPEAVTAVASFDDFGDAHADLETRIDVSLPGGTSYIHFPGHETGHVLVFLDTAGVFVTAYDGEQTELTTESLGANEDCSAELAEVWEVYVENDTGTPTPQILELTGAGTVRMIILEAGAH